MNGGALYQITTYAIISFYENYSKPLVILSLIFGIVVLLEIYSLPTLWHKIKEIFSNNKDPDESKQGQREQHSPTLHPKRIKSSPPHFNPNNNGKLKKYGFSKKLERNKKKKDQLSCGGEDKLVASTSLRQLSSVEKDFHLESKPLPLINDVKSINDAFNGTPTLPAQPSPKAESKKCVSKNTPKLVPKGETDSSNLFSEPFVEVSRRHTNNISKNSQAPLPKLNKKVFLKHQGSKGELVSSKALSSHQKVMTHLVVNSSNKIKANALAKNETHPNNNNSFKLSLNEIEKSWKEYDEWSDLKTQSLVKTIETSCGNNSSARLPLKLYSSVLRDITLTTLNEPKIALSETNCTDNSIEKCKVGEWQTSEKIQITPKVPCTLEMDCTIVHQLKRSCELLMEKNEELLAEKSKGPPEESEFKFLTSWDDDEIFLGENKNSLSKFVPSSFPLTNIQIYPNQITHNIHESIEKEAIKEKEITSAYDYTLALFTNANNEERSSFADAPPFKSPFEDDGSWTSSLFFTPGATETKSNRFRFPISLNSELPNKTSETPAESSSDYNSMTPSPSSAGKEANLNNNCFFNQSAASHYSLEKTLLKGSDAFFTAPLCEYNPFIFPTPLGTIGYDGVEDGDEEPFEETVEEYDPSSIKKFIEIMIDTGDIDVEKHKSIKMRSHDLVTRPPFFTKPVIEQLPELPIRNTIIHKFPTFDEIQLENGYFEDKPSNKIPIQVVKPLCQPRAKRILKITKPTKPTLIERKIIPSKPPRLFAQKQQLPRQQRLLMTTATFFQPLYPINLRIVHVKQPHFKPQMMPPHHKSPVMQQFKLQLSPMFRQQFISPFNIQQPLPQMIHQPNPNPNLAPSQRQLNNIFRGNVCVQPLVQKIIPIKTFRDLCHFKETLYVLSHSLIKSEKIVVDKSLYTFLSYELEVKPSNVGFLTGVIVYRGIVSTNTYSNDGYIMDAQVLVNYYPKETSEDANPITAKGIIISIKPPIYYKSFTCIQVVVLIESLQSGLLLPNEFKAVIAKYTTSKICLRSFINTYPETTTELDIFTETISNSAAGQCFFKSMIDSFIPPPSKTFDDVNVAPMSNILDDDQIAMIKICLRNKTIASAYSMPGSGKTFAATEIANQDCFGMQIYVTHSDASADLLLRHFERFSKHKVRPFPLFNLSHRTPGSEYYESGEFGLGKESLLLLHVDESETKLK
uniref:DNA helicase n=1 Tax=Rhabditophanes sp. KR3021 TaxID=114890 RepID=A0AC35U1B7_9BILA